MPLADFKDELRMHNPEPIIVGEAYLNLLAQWELGTESLETDEEEGFVLDKITIVSKTDLELERDKAEALVEQLNLSGIMTKIFVEDPQVLDDGIVDPGFYTTRKVQLGDYVVIPADLKADFEAIEPCEQREQETDLSKRNKPDTNPYGMLGMYEEDISYKITLADILEHKFRSLDPSLPVTTAALKLLSSYGEICYSQAFRNWARRRQEPEFTLLQAIAVDRRRLNRTFTKDWHYAWACDQVFVNINDRYARVYGDKSLMWIKSIREMYE